MSGVPGRVAAVGQDGRRSEEPPVHGVGGRSDLGGGELDVVQLDVAERDVQ